MLFIAPPEDRYALQRTEPAGAACHAARLPMATRPRLLYVEDHAESLELVERLLAGRKYPLLVRAASLDQALKLARRRRPEVMLINLELAGLGAPELMRRLRAEPATRTAPILALAADTRPGAVVKGLEAGVFLYLAKPLQAEPFIESLAYALEFAAVERSEQPLSKESR
jgi:CheY-like chemotaxis protein